MSGWAWFILGWFVVAAALALFLGAVIRAGRGPEPPKPPR